MLLIQENFWHNIRKKVLLENFQVKIFVSLNKFIPCDLFDISKCIAIIQIVKHN